MNAIALMCHDLVTVVKCLINSVKSSNLFTSSTVHNHTIIQYIRVLYYSNATVTALVTKNQPMPEDNMRKCINKSV